MSRNRRCGQSRSGGWHNCNWTLSRSTTRYCIRDERIGVGHVEVGVLAQRRVLPPRSDADRLVIGLRPADVVHDQADVVQLPERRRHRARLGHADHRRELAGDPLVELVEIEHRRIGRGQVVRGGTGVEHPVEGGAHGGVQTEGGEVGAPGQQVDERQPGAGGIGTPAAGAVR